MAELKRTLGYWTILALAIGSIMGSGMFFGVAIGAGYSGNASIISWVILSFVAVYIGACFGELTSMFPKAGGVYEFAKQTYGRFSSFIIAWTAWIVGNLTSALLIVAAIEYLIPNPELKTLKMIICVGVVLFLNFVAFIGIEASAAMLVMFAALAITVILSLVIPGFFHINMENFSPFFLDGISPIFVTMFFIAECFFGWESATYLAEETKDPKKIIPKALIIGTVIVALMSISIAVVSLGVVPWKILITSSAPLSLVSSKIFGVKIIKIIGPVIFFVLIGSAAGGIVTMPRLVLALARDKLFLSQFGNIHPRFKTPYKAIIFQTVISLIIFAMAFGKYKILLSLLLPLGMIMYIFIILSVPILRAKNPDYERSFKVPFAKIGPILVVLFIVGLIVAWLFTEPNAWSLLRLGFSFIAISIPLYLLVELYYDPKMITSSNDILAHLTLLTEKISIPVKVRKEILTLLGDIKGKTVLEYGCSIGTITPYLATAIGPEGKIYGTNHSKNEIKIARKRVDNLAWLSDERIHAYFHTIHDEEHTNRIHPSIKYVDAAVSVGMMSYVQDIKKVLGELNQIMPDQGKICFVDYGDFFHILPNVEWLARNETIENIFRECGFSVRVLRKKGLFWNYIYIYGMKSEEQVPFI